MGLEQFDTADTNIVQSFSLGSHQIHTGRYGGTDRTHLYIVQASTDKARQYKFNFGTGMLDMPAVSQSPRRRQRAAGGIMCLSANGTNAGKWHPVGDA